MFKKLLVILLSGVICFGATACKKKLTKAQVNAAQEQKKREEKRQKAARYYEELAKRYPESEWAPKAKERLQAMGPVATPAAKKK